MVQNLNNSNFLSKCQNSISGTDYISPSWTKFRWKPYCQGKALDLLVFVSEVVVLPRKCIARYLEGTVQANYKSFFIQTEKKKTFSIHWHLNTFCIHFLYFFRLQYFMTDNNVKIYVLYPILLLQNCSWNSVMYKSILFQVN